MNDPRFKISVNLKQHTHLVHFQHDQMGATLRASEAKPKLDRFILSRCFNDDFEQYKMFLIGYNASTEAEKIAKGKNYQDDFKDKLALNYKLRFISGNKKVSKDSIPLYFGNQGEDSIPKYNVLDSQTIRMEISSFNTDLIEKIREANLIGDFFALHNFGTRQGKGLGSFYPEDETTYPVNEALFDYRAYLRLGDAKEQTDHSKIYESIDLFYKSIRAGINIPNQFYFKSLLFLYFHQQGVKWEKKKIKEEFFLDNIGKHGRRDNQVRPWALRQQQANYPDDGASPVHVNFEDEKLIRDLLGLSSSETWQSYSNATVTKKQAEQVNGQYRTKREADLERYPSPIFFKVIRNLNQNNFYRVYIKLSQDNPIGGNYFMINSNRGNGEPFPLQVPDDFSLSDFFAFFMNRQRFNIRNHVDQRFHRRGEFRSLNQFYTALTPIQ